VSVRRTARKNKLRACPRWGGRSEKKKSQRLLSSAAVGRNGEGSAGKTTNCPQSSVAMPVKNRSWLGRKEKRDSPKEKRAAFLPEKSRILQQKRASPTWGNGGGGERWRKGYLPTSFFED